MFWKAFGLALLVMVAIGGIAGSATFGLLYANKNVGLDNSQGQATATAAYENGREVGKREGEAAGEAKANTCDRVVGAAANDGFAGKKPGETVGMKLTVRSTKTGSTYEVVTGSVCKIADDLKTCHAEEQYQIGAPWPLGCK